MAEERRKFERHPVNVPARIGEENALGTLRDISGGGIAVVTNEEFEQEQKMQVCFQMEEEILVCEGTIKVKLKREGNLTYGIAFLQKFIEQTQKVVEKIEDLQAVQIKKA